MKLGITDDMMKAIRATARQAVRNCMMTDGKEFTHIHERIINAIVEDVVAEGIDSE